MSACQPGEGWWSGPQYQQYWQDLRKVEERLQGDGVHPIHLHGGNGHPNHLGEERKRGGAKREAAYWKAMAAGLQYENSQLQSLLRSLLGLESHPSPQMGMTATNINVGPPTEPVYNRHQGQNRADVHNYGVSQWLKYYRHGVVQSSSSEDDSSSDSEEEDCVEVTGDESKQVEDILGVDSFHEKKVEVDPSEEEYFRFLAVSEKHKKERDGVEGESLKKKFDFRTDTITDAVLEEGLALIDTDHEKTKREMGKLFGSRAMKVHSEETKAQLRFDNWRDQNNAVLWPALPLKIIR